MRAVPAIIDAAFVARALGWTTQKARRWLKSTEAGAKRGGRWVTTLSKLQTHFPEAMGSVLMGDDDE